MKTMTSFNSLQAGKWILTSAKIRILARLEMCFNSLQAGKWILTKHWHGFFAVHMVCFNSLQAGKWILTRTKNGNGRNRKVSIPFKRESGS